MEHIPDSKTGQKERSDGHEWEELLDIIFDEPVSIPAETGHKSEAPNTFRRSLRWSIEQDPFCGVRVKAWSRLHETSYRCVDMALVIGRWFSTAKQAWKWLHTDAANAVRKNAALQPAVLTPMEEAAIDDGTTDEERKEILDALLGQ